MPGTLQGGQQMQQQQQQQRSVTGPKVVGELLKAVEGTATAAKKRAAAAEQQAAPAAAAMVLAKEMATGRKSLSSVAVGGLQSPRTARASGIPVRPKPVPPSTASAAGRKTAVVDEARKQQQLKSTAAPSRRPTSVDRRAKVLYASVSYRCRGRWIRECARLVFCWRRKNAIGRPEKKKSSRSPLIGRVCVAYASRGFFFLIVFGLDAKKSLLRCVRKKHWTSPVVLKMLKIPR